MDPVYSLMSVLLTSRLEPAEKQEHFELDECIRPCRVGQTDFGTFWKDTKMGFKKCINYILKLLDQNHITAVVIDPESVWLFDWLNEMKVTYAKASTHEEGSLDEKQYEHVLRHCNPLDALIIPSEAPENFRYDGPFHKLSMLYIQSGSWVTIDNLLAIGAISIQIGSCSLTSLDINRYLKNWMTGNCRSKVILLYMKDIGEVEPILEGLEERVQTKEEKRKYMWRDKSHFPIRKCYDMTRDDGVIASLQFSTTANGKSQFTMFVWPDFDGRSHLEARD